MTGLIISDYQWIWMKSSTRTGTRMVTLPLGPHEFDSAACGNLGRVVRWHIVLAVDANVARNSIGLNLGSARGHSARGTSTIAYSKQAVCHGSIVLKLAGYLVHPRLLGVLVGVPGIDEVLTQPDLLDISVGRRQG